MTITKSLESKPSQKGPRKPSPVTPNTDQRDEEKEERAEHFHQDAGLEGEENRVLHGGGQGVDENRLPAGQEAKYRLKGTFTGEIS